MDSHTSNSELHDNSASAVLCSSFIDDSSFSFYSIFDILPFVHLSPLSFTCMLICYVFWDHSYIYLILCFLHSHDYLLFSPSFVHSFNFSFLPSFVNVPAFLHLPFHHVFFIPSYIYFLYFLLILIHYLFPIFPYTFNF